MDAPRLCAWRELTTQNLTVRRYLGGHFYLRELHERVVLDVAGDLLASTAIG